MHRAILAQLAEIEDYRRVSHIWCGREQNILAAFAKDGKGLEWVAKVVRGPEEIRVLEREHAALAYLQPWASELGIPTVLSWDPGVDTACLIQTGIQGTPARFNFRAEDAGPDLEEALRKPWAWLERFQKLVPPPRRMTVAQRVDELVRQVDAKFPGSPVVQVLLTSRERVPRLLEKDATSAHGDFVPTNFLLTANGIGVFDWGEFHSGVPLQDLFTLLSSVSYRFRDRTDTLVNTYAHAFFTPSPANRAAAGLLAGEKFSEEELHLCFYAFLGTRICVQGSVAAAQWMELLAYLRQLGYPAPCRQAYVS